MPERVASSPDAAAEPVPAEALPRPGSGGAADLLLGLQRTHGNAAVGRLIARAPKTLHTVEEKILDEILNQKRPERLRELFTSVDAKKAQALEKRLTTTSKDVLGLRFNADLDAELRAHLLAILRGKHDPQPAPAPAPLPPGALPEPAPRRTPLEMDYIEEEDAWRILETAKDANYVDNSITQVARALAGPSNDYLLFLAGAELPGGSLSTIDAALAISRKQLPVRLEPWRVDFTGRSTPVREQPYEDRESALAAVAAAKAQDGGEYHAYHKAVYGMTVPTVFSPATTPNIIEMIGVVEAKRAAEAKAAADSFTLMALGIGLGLAAGTLVGAGLKWATRPKKGGAPEPAVKPAAPAVKLAKPTVTVYGKPVHATPQGTLYHGARPDLTPDVVLKSGLPARGSNMDLIAHVKGGSDTGMRGATRLASAPGDGKQGAAYWADEGGWVYELEGVDGWDVNQTLAAFPRSPDGIETHIRSEIEVAIPAQVPASRIKRYGQVVESPSGKLYVKDWKTNPGFGANH